MDNPNKILWSDIGGVFVGSAYIFGDQTGNARGAAAMDLQASHSAVTQVASGENSTAIGSNSTASGARSTASGYYCTASGNYSVAIGSAVTASAPNSLSVGSDSDASASGSSTFGNDNVASGNLSTAIGSKNQASGAKSTASGYYSSAAADGSTASGFYAAARIVNTTNICGPQICRRDDGEAAGKNFHSFCGTQVILRTNEVSLKAAATHTITLPSGCHFFPDECGVNVTSLNTLTIQPTISFGITGSNAALKAAAITTALTAQFSRERFQTLLTAAGQTTLTATVTVGATATTLLGTFYLKGILIEDE